MKIEITKQQLQAVINMKDDIEAMIGCGEDDSHWVKNVRLVKRMLKKNKLEPEYRPAKNNGA